MADTEDRRGDSNMVDADASTTTDGEIKPEAESISNEAKSENTSANIEKSQSVPAASEKNIDLGNVVNTDSKIAETDSEGTRNKLAKAREELNRALAESAKAKIDVEKIKHDLAEAENDSITSCQGSITSIKVQNQDSPNIANEQVLNEEVNIEELSTAGDSVSEMKEKEDVSCALVSNDSLESDSQPVSANESLATQAVENVESTSARELDAPENVDRNDETKEEGEIDGEEETEGDEEVIVEGEREEGDGEESENASTKPLDDDEDRRNPQYIPKRGGFYEHDDRTREETEEIAEEQPQVEEKPKKGSRSEVVDRWGHDMFDESQQGPKSDQELVTLYGYDIRVEEGAPRARRRRRYGRGPNKYDRTWEDEEAYARPRPRGGAASRGDFTGSSRGGAAGGGGGGGGSGSGGDDAGPSPRGGVTGSSSRGGVTSRGDSFGPSRGGATSRGDWSGPSRGGATSRGDFAGPSRGGATQRGGFGASSRGSGKDRSKMQDRSSSREDFPPLPNQKSDNQVDPANSSSANWRDDSRADNKAANAISFRRGGGGRTFEERNQSKMIKGRGENLVESPGQADGDVEEESLPKDNWKSSAKGEEFHRGGRGGPNRGGRGGPSRGASAFRGRGRDNMNWDQNEHRPGRVGQADMETSDMKGRGRGKFGRAIDKDPATMGLQQLHIDDRPQPDTNVSRSKRYSSQRQRMTTPPPAGGVVMPSYVASTGSTAYYASYSDSPPNYGAPPSSAPLLPLVGTQGAPPPYIGYTATGPAAGASFTAGFQGYSPATAPPIQVGGVPISSPTQDMYGGAGNGIMYFDPGRQPVRPGTQPPRRPKAAIPIVAPDNDADNLILPGR